VILALWLWGLARLVRQRPVSFTDNLRDIVCLERRPAAG
jgi:hypothetical protein